MPLSNTLRQLCKLQPFKEHLTRIRRRQRCLKTLGGCWKKRPLRRIDTVTPAVAFLRTRVKNCRGVPFKGHRGLGGCRLKESSKNGGGPGRKGGGGEGKPSPLRGFKTRRGSANLGTMFANSNPEKLNPRWAATGFRRRVSFKAKNYIEGSRLKEVQKLSP